MGNIYRIRFIKKFKRLVNKKSNKSNKFNIFHIIQQDFAVSEASLKVLEREAKGKFEIVRQWTGKEIEVTPHFSQETLLEDPPTQDAIEEVIAATVAEHQKGHPLIPMYRGRSLDKIPNTFLLDRPGGKRHYRWSWETDPGDTTPLKEHFKNIIEAANDPDTRFVLSLGSGGLRLFAHASMMKIIDSLELKSSIDEIWGCSGGSIAGLFYSMGISPETIEEEGYNIYNRKSELTLHPSKRELIKNAISELVLPSNPFVLRGLMSIQEALKDLMTRVTEQGGRDPEIPFYGIAYNMHKKMNQALTPCDVDPETYQGLVHTVTPLDAILASSSIPLLYVPKVIKSRGLSHIYVDGGAAEEVPLLTIHRKWRIDQNKGLTDKKKMFILAVNLFPQVAHLKIFRSKFFRKLPFMDIIKWGGHLADLIREARIEDHMHILRDDPSVIVKQVVLTYPAPGVLVPHSIPQVIVRARKSFFKQLLEIEKDWHKKV